MQTLEERATSLADQIWGEVSTDAESLQYSIKLAVDALETQRAIDMDNVCKMALRGAYQKVVSSHDE